MEANYIIVARQLGKRSLVATQEKLARGGFTVPEISRFLGIVIAMFYNDHAPPLFHARYGELEIRVDIQTGQVLSGDFPRRALALVLEWLELHRDDLMLDWILAGERKPLRKIAPLE